MSAHDNERQAFLKALTENEDDTLARMVYADWLEEQGEHEEADRHRQWPAAKAWLKEFCKEYNPDPGDPDPYECVIPYEELVELAREAIGEPRDSDDGEQWYNFSCGSNQSMRDALESNRREFWKNWSVVTGIPLPDDIESRSSFSCGC